MLKNDTLKNGTSHIGLYGSAPWASSSLFIKEKEYTLLHRSSALQTEYPGSEHGAKRHARSSMVKQLNASVEESGNNNRGNS